MMSMAEADNRQVMRPLKVLVPLIKEDLQHGDEAAAQAGLPYYAAAGEKLLEAQEQLKPGEFFPWAERTFGRNRRTLQRYMQAATTTEDMRRRRHAPPPTTLSKLTGDTRHHHQAAWKEPVQVNIERAKAEAQRLRDETLTRQQEREAERKLALRLIDIGFKVLSKELHPDKGGSRDAMTRLNRVRNRLKDVA